MNKEFVTKMLQAKQMEFQALKEILPENLVNRIEKLEYEIVDIAKEYFTSIPTDKLDKYKTKASSAENKTRKVTIE